MKKEKKVNDTNLSIEELVSHLLEIISAYKDEIETPHPFDIAKELEKLRELDEEEYKSICKKMPSELLAETLCEMPNYVQEEISEVISEKKIANIVSKMDSDDASMLIYNIAQDHEDAAETILSKLDDEDKEVIEKLNSYEENVAGSHMQSELFSAKLDENIGLALKRLKQLKEIDELDNIFHAYLIDKDDKFIGTIGLEELILFEHSQSFDDIPKEKIKNYSCKDNDDISDVVETFTNYNLSALAVIDENEKLVGRITHDDIHDIIQEQNTKQIYSLAGVNDEAEHEEDIVIIGKNRAFWLGINLLL
jgi:magnesium transporter